jgi:hypothetical protein
MPKPSPTDPLTHILAAGKEGGRHSPLYLWMKKNHAALTAEFAANGPQWSVRARAMGDAGLVDADEKKPSQRTAMQTWYRVCRDLGKPRRQDRVRNDVGPQLAPVQPTADDPDDDDDEEEIEWTTADGTVHRTKIPKQK